MDNVVNGFVAGSAQTIIGHPFDTIKTRLQMGKKMGSNFYRGFIPPLIGGCLQNSFLFGTEKYFDKYFQNSFISGFVSGSLSTIIISPAEYIKCNQQKHSNLSMTQIIRQHNIMRGFWTTFARDSIGFGIYFSLYDYLQRKRDNPLVNGGVAGVASWIYSYQIDTLKTRQQTSNMGVLDIWRGMRVKELGRGMGWMLMRAYLVNAGIFYIFEKMKENSIIPECKK